jgi:hypothetical protein
LKEELKETNRTNSPVLSTMSEINEGSHGGVSDDDIEVLTEDEKAALIQQFFDEMERKDLEDGLERDHHERVEYALQLFADIEREDLEREHQERVVDELNSMSLIGTCARVSIPRCRPPESWWTLPTGIAEENIVASFEESRFVSNEPEDENDDGADVLDFNDPGRFPDLDGEAYHEGAHAESFHDDGAEGADDPCFYTMSETQGAGNSPPSHESGTNGNDSGRGGRGRGNGRGNGNRSGRGSGGTGSAAKPFLGATAGMNGHVFSMSRRDNENPTVHQNRPRTERSRDQDARVFAGCGIDLHTIRTDAVNATG